MKTKGNKEVPNKSNHKLDNQSINFYMFSK